MVCCVTLKSRSLAVSIGLHAVFAAVFLMWISNNPPKSLPEPIKIHVTSFFAPTVVQKVITPLKSQPAPKIVKTTPPIHPTVQSLPIKQATVMQPRVNTPVLQPAPVVIAATPVTVQIPVVVAPIAVKETPKAIAPPVNSEKEFLDAHLGEIRSLLLQNLKYPANARRLKMQGEVRVSFLLNTDGSVENIKVIESSGFEILDEDAMKLIEKTASRFPKPTKSVRINAPLGYVLR